MPNEAINVGGLITLAARRSYTVLLSPDGCVLINLKTHRSERNKANGTFVFSRAEAWAFLEQLSVNIRRVRARTDGTRGRVGRRQ